MTEAKLSSYTSVRKWLGSIAESTGEGYLWHFEAFMDWAKVNSSKFGSMTPDELVEYALDATPRQINELLDAKKDYLHSMKGRLNHKVNANKSITSFFTHNRMELPVDRTLNLRGDKPKVEGSLTPENVKQIVLSSNVQFQAIFLIMLGSGMGQSELVLWSDEGFDDLKTQLDSHAELVKVELHGRKGDRNNYNYTTFIGGDALKALKRYMTQRGEKPGAIFINNIHKPLTQFGLYQYWTRKVKRLGLPSTGHAGNNPHEVRDVFRTLWRRSGVPIEYGEFFMGHREAFDKYGYDKTAQDEDELRKQYIQALPFLNILSEAKPFKLVKEDDVEKEVQRQVEKRLREAEVNRDAELARVKEEVRAEFKSMLDEMKTAYGLDRYAPSQPNEIRVQLHNDNDKIFIGTKNYESGKKAKDEVDRLT